MTAGIRDHRLTITVDDNRGTVRLKIDTYYSTGYKSHTQTLTFHRSRFERALNEAGIVLPLRAVNGEGVGR